MTSEGLVTQGFISLMLILSCYYLYQIATIPEVYYVWVYIVNYNSTRYSQFRRKMSTLGISHSNIFQLSILAQNSAELLSKISEYFSSHPQCPITLEDVVDDETHHIKPHISAVFQYDNDKEIVHWNCFSSEALQRWVTQGSSHPLTRCPMSEYIVIDLS